jgi:hypothetical protein
MSEWRRISEDDFASFGDNELHFNSKDHEYVVRVAETEQNRIAVLYGDQVFEWPIELKEQKDSEFRLSGLAMNAQDFLGDVYWFELLICENPEISYWANRIRVRQDFCG